MDQPDLDWKGVFHEELTVERLETPGLHADNEPTVVPWVTYLQAPSPAQAYGHVSQEFLRNGKCLQRNSEAGSPLTAGSSLDRKPNPASS